MILWKKWKGNQNSQDKSGNQNSQDNLGNHKTSMIPEQIWKKQYYLRKINQKYLKKSNKKKKKLMI